MVSLKRRKETKSGKKMKYESIDIKHIIPKIKKEDKIGNKQVNCRLPRQSCKVMNC